MGLPSQDSGVTAYVALQLPIGGDQQGFSCSQGCIAVSKSVRFRPHLPSRQAIAFALMMATLAVAAPVTSAQDAPNSATIQWAQQILDQQGLYQGRASGKLDSATAAAISAYQKKQGLKATGRLDAGTIARMMQDQPERKGVGNLADPGSRAKHSQPMLREADIKPQAAPSAPSVDRGEGQETTLLGVSRGPTDLPAARSSGSTSAILPPAPSTSPPPAVRNEAGPTAAPRDSVDTEVTLETPEASPFDPANWTVPNWARFGLIGAIGLLLLGMLGNWWLGGRRGAKARRPAPTRTTPAGPVRVEPTLSSGPLRPDGRREPVFTAPIRDQHRVG